jgi:hypothetical protein
MPVLNEERILVVKGPPGRGSQMNAGARIASGDILLFVPVDTALPPDAAPWITPVLSVLGMNLIPLLYRLGAPPTWLRRLYPDVC